ncbi:MAG TPA: helix-turn-helix transcriptional regulator [Pseudonocardiaceae bacterium]
MPLAKVKLREIRRKSGIKSGAFAVAVKLSRNHYVNVEGRRKPASVEAFARFATLLNVEIDEIMDVDDVPQAGAA